MWAFTYIDVIDESANILTVGVGLDEVAGGVGRIGEVSDVVAVDAHIDLHANTSVTTASTAHLAC